MRSTALPLRLSRAPIGPPLAHTLRPSSAPLVAGSHGVPACCPIERLLLSAVQRHARSHATTAFKPQRPLVRRRPKVQLLGPALPPAPLTEDAATPPGSGGLAETEESAVREIVAAVSNLEPWMAELALPDARPLLDRVSAEAVARDGPGAAEARVAGVLARAVDGLLSGPQGLERAESLCKAAMWLGIAPGSASAAAVAAPLARHLALRPDGDWARFQAMLAGLHPSASGPAAEELRSLAALGLAVRGDVAAARAALPEGGAAPERRWPAALLLGAAAAARAAEPERAAAALRAIGGALAALPEEALAPGEARAWARAALADARVAPASLVPAAEALSEGLASGGHAARAAEARAGALDAAADRGLAEAARVLAPRVPGGSLGLARALASDPPASPPSWGPCWRRPRGGGGGRRRAAGARDGGGGGRARAAAEAGERAAQGVWKALGGVEKTAAPAAVARAWRRRRRWAAGGPLGPGGARGGAAGGAAAGRGRAAASEEAARRALASVRAGRPVSRGACVALAEAAEAARSPRLAAAAAHVLREWSAKAQRPADRRWAAVRAAKALAPADSARAASAWLAASEKAAGADSGAALAALHAEALAALPPDLAEAALREAAERHGLALGERLAPAAAAAHRAAGFELRAQRALDLLPLQALAGPLRACPAPCEADREARGDAGADAGGEIAVEDFTLDAVGAMGARSVRGSTAPLGALAASLVAAALEAPSPDRVASAVAAAVPRALSLSGAHRARALAAAVASVASEHFDVDRAEALALAGPAAGLPLSPAAALPVMEVLVPPPPPPSPLFDLGGGRRGRRAGRAGRWRRSVLLGAARAADGDLNGARAAVGRVARPRTSPKSRLRGAPRPLTPLLGRFLLTSRGRQACAEGAAALLAVFADSVERPAGGHWAPDARSARGNRVSRWALDLFRSAAHAGRFREAVEVVLEGGALPQENPPRPDRRLFDADVALGALWALKEAAAEGAALEDVGRLADRVCAGPWMDAFRRACVAAEGRLAARAAAPPGAAGGAWAVDEDEAGEAAEIMRGRRVFDYAWNMFTIEASLPPNPAAATWLLVLLRVAGHCARSQRDVMVLSGLLPTVIGHRLLGPPAVWTLFGPLKARAESGAFEPLKERLRGFLVHWAAELCYAARRTPSLGPGARHEVLRIAEAADPLLDDVTRSRLQMHAQLARGAGNPAALSELIAKIREEHARNRTASFDAYMEITRLVMAVGEQDEEAGAAAASLLQEARARGLEPGFGHANEAVARTVAGDLRGSLVSLELARRAIERKAAAVRSEIPEGDRRLLVFAHNTIIAAIVNETRDGRTLSEDEVSTVIEVVKRAGAARLPIHPALTNRIGRALVATPAYPARTLEAALRSLGRTPGTTREDRSHPEFPLPSRVQRLAEARARRVGEGGAAAGAEEETGVEGEEEEEEEKMGRRRRRQQRAKAAAEAAAVEAAASAEAEGAAPGRAEAGGAEEDPLAGTGLPPMPPPPPRPAGDEDAAEAEAGGKRRAKGKKGRKGAGAGAGERD
eukprot:tig00021137_g18987.t1